MAGRPPNDKPNKQQINLKIEQCTRDALDALATSLGKVTLGAEYAINQWYWSLREAAQANTESLTDEEWNFLGRVSSGLWDLEELRGGDDYLATDWTQRLWAECTSDNLAPKGLAKKLAKFSRAQGFALMMALRYWWDHRDAGIVVCQEPSIWLTPTAKGKK